MTVAESDTPIYPRVEVEFQCVRLFHCEHPWDVRFYNLPRLRRAIELFDVERVLLAEFPAMEPRAAFEYVKAARLIRDCRLDLTPKE